MNQRATIEGLHGLRHVAMSCDNLYCNFFILGASESMEWSVYCQSLSAVARARYESKVLQAGLGIVSYSIDYLTPAVYFARNRQMVQERALHTLAGGRKELYMSDRIKHPTTQQVLLDRRATLSLRFAPNVKFYVL